VLCVCVCVCVYVVCVWGSADKGEIFQKPTVNISSEFDGR